MAKRRKDQEPGLGAYGDVVLDVAPALEIRVEDAEPPESLRQEAIPIVQPPISLAKLIELFADSPWLAAVGKLIRDAVGGAKVELRPVVAEPDEAQRDRLEEWISRPAIAVDGLTELDLHEFLATAALHDMQTGNVFVEVLRDSTGAPSALALIPPQTVWFEWEERPGREGFWVLHMITPDGREALFVPLGRRGEGEERHEYLHRRRPNLLSSFFGVPDWLEARYAVEVDIAHRNYLLRFFQNDTTPRRILTIRPDPEWAKAGHTIPKDAALTDVRRLITSFMAANRGQAASRSLILQLPGGVKLEDMPLAVKTEDPTFEKASRDARDTILAVLRVSLVDLGLPEGGYRATAEAQSRSFREQVLVPAGKGAARLINRLVRAPEPVGLGITDWELTLTFERPEELLARMEALVKAAGVPIISPDEARKLGGLPEVGDDSLYRPPTMIPFEPELEE